MAKAGNSGPRSREPKPKAALDFRRPAQRIVRFRDFEFSSPELRMLSDEKEYRSYLDRLQRDPWEPRHLLDLVEGLLRGDPREQVLARVAKARGCTREDVLDRWKKMTLPIKNTSGIVTTGGSTLLLRLLRENIGGDHEEGNAVHRDAGMAPRRRRKPVEA